MSNQPMTIGIDPGHGGLDRGAVYHGIEESDLTVGYASELAVELEARGFRTCMTRQRDIPATERVTLAKRGDATKRAGCDLVVSIHANAFAQDQRVKGAIVFYAPHSGKAKLLAHAIYERLPEPLKTRRQGVQAAVSEAWPRVHACLKPHAAPAVLIETGFLTNPEEAHYLTRPETTRAVVRAIADGIEAVAKK